MTSSGWSWWMLCPLLILDELGEILPQRGHDPFHLVARKARKWRGKGDAVGQNDERRRAQRRVRSRLAYLTGGGVVRQRGGIPPLHFRVRIQQLLVGDGERFELRPPRGGEGLLKAQLDVLVGTVE